MASPQLENGYFLLSTELLEALTKIRIPGESRQIFDHIIRQTYGWHKKEDTISLSQFILATGLKKPNIIRSIRKLLSMNLIVIKKDNAGSSIYYINKDFSTWIPLSKKITVIQKDNLPLSKKIPTKYNNIKNNNIYRRPEKISGSQKPKKEKKIYDGEKDRGKDTAFDGVLDFCKKRGIQVDMKVGKYLEMREEYREKVNWKNEVFGCINWLYDKGLKVLNSARLRNRMAFAIEKDKQNQQRLKNYNLEKKYAPELKKPEGAKKAKQQYDTCYGCGNVMTPMGELCSNCSNNS